MNCNYVLLKCYFYAIITSNTNIYLEIAQQQVHCFAPSRHNRMITVSITNWIVGCIISCCLCIVIWWLINSSYLTNCDNCNRIFVRMKTKQADSMRTHKFSLWPCDESTKGKINKWIFNCRNTARALCTRHGPIRIFFGCVCIIIQFICFLFIVKNSYWIVFFIEIILIVLFRWFFIWIVRASAVVTASSKLMMGDRENVSNALY